MQAHYQPAPRGHLFRTVRSGRRCRLLVRCAAPDGTFEPDEQELASAPDTRAGWGSLGARAVHVHSGCPLPVWIGRATGEKRREAAVAGHGLPSREL